MSEKGCRHKEKLLLGEDPLSKATPLVAIPGQNHDFILVAYKGQCILRATFVKRENIPVDLLRDWNTKKARIASGVEKEFDIDRWQEMQDQYEPESGIMEGYQTEHAREHTPIRSMKEVLEQQTPVRSTEEFVERTPIRSDGEEMIISPRPATFKLPLSLSASRKKHTNVDDDEDESPIGGRRVRVNRHKSDDSDDEPLLKKKERLSGYISSQKKAEYVNYTRTLLPQHTNRGAVAGSERNPASQQTSQQPARKQISIISISSDSDSDDDDQALKSVQITRTSTTNTPAKKQLPIQDASSSEEESTLTPTQKSLKSVPRELVSGASSIADHVSKLTTNPSTLNTDTIRVEPRSADARVKKKAVQSVSKARCNPTTTPVKTLNKTSYSSAASSFVAGLARLEQPSDSRGQFTNNPVRMKPRNERAPDPSQLHMIDIGRPEEPSIEERVRLDNEKRANAAKAIKPHTAQMLERPTPQGTVTALSSAQETSKPSPAAPVNGTGLQAKPSPSKPMLGSLIKQIEPSQKPAALVSPSTETSHVGSSESLFVNQNEDVFQPESVDKDATNDKTATEFSAPHAQDTVNAAPSAVPKTQPSRPESKLYGRQSPGRITKRPPSPPGIELSRRPDFTVDKSIVCEDFLAKNCQFSEKDCKNSHDETLDRGRRRHHQPKHTTHHRLQDITCHYWRDRNNCRLGSKCEYAHRDTGIYSQRPRKRPADQPPAMAMNARKLEPPIEPPPVPQGRVSGEPVRRDSAIKPNAGRRDSAVNTSAIRRDSVSSQASLPEQKDTITPSVFTVAGSPIMLDYKPQGHEPVSWPITLNFFSDAEAKIASMLCKGSTRGVMKSLITPEEFAMLYDDKINRCSKYPMGYVACRADGFNAHFLTYKGSSVEARVGIVQQGDFELAIFGGTKDAFQAMGLSKLARTGNRHPILFRLLPGSSQSESTVPESDVVDYGSSAGILSLDMNTLLGVSDKGYKHRKVFIWTNKPDSGEVTALVRMIQALRCEFTICTDASTYNNTTARGATFVITSGTPFYQLKDFRKHLEGDETRTFRMSAANQSNINGLERIFPRGTAVLITNDIFAHQPEAATKILQAFYNQAKDAKESGRDRKIMVTRPYLRSWLRSLATDGEQSSDARRVKLFEAFRALCPNDNMQAEHEIGSSKSLITHPLTGDRHVQEKEFYDEYWSTDPTTTTDNLVDDFTLWSHRNAHHYGHFIVIHEAKRSPGEVDPRNWEDKYQHVNVVTPSGWLQSLAGQKQ